MIDKEKVDMFAESTSPKRHYSRVPMMFIVYWSVLIWALFTTVFIFKYSELMPFPDSKSELEENEHEPDVAAVDLESFQPDI